MVKIKHLLIAVLGLLAFALPANAQCDDVPQWDSSKAYNVYGEEPGVRVQMNGKLYELASGQWAPKGAGPESAWSYLWTFIGNCDGTGGGNAGGGNENTGGNQGGGADNGGSNDNGGAQNTNHQLVGGLHKHLMIGYWHNFRNGLTGPGEGLKLSEASTNYDFLNVSFGETAANDRATITFELDKSIYGSDAEFIADIQKCQARGQKVNLSLGGQNGIITVNDEAGKKRFVNSVVSIIEKYGFDGLDIDFEGSSAGGGNQGSFDAPTATQQLMISALREVCDHFGKNFILTMAPETAYVQFGINSSVAPAYLPLIYGLRDKLTVLHVQLYNTGTSSALDDKNYTPGTADYLVAMCDMLLQGFKNSGKTFPALAEDQVAIGIPTPGTAAAGSGIPASVDVVKNALQYLITGKNPGGISYQLRKADGYPGFRGVMTWSVNYDKQINNNLANTITDYFKEVGNPILDGQDSGDDQGNGNNQGGDDNQNGNDDQNGDNQNDNNQNDGQGSDNGGSSDNGDNGGNGGGNVTAGDNGKKFVVYFPNWGTYNPNHQSISVGMIPWDKVTHIHHGFWQVSNNFKAETTDEWSDFQKADYGHGDGFYNANIPDDQLQNGHFAEYRYYKQQYPNVKVLISIGGWTKGNNFHAMASSAANRAIFIQSIIDVLKKYPYIDGIDLDWEYPGVNRAKDPNDSADLGCPGGPEDKENFVSLVKEIREAYNKNGMPEKLLSIAASMNPNTVAQGPDPAQYAQYLDYINIMTYDAHGAFESTTNHHAAIYPSPNDPAEGVDKQFNAMDAGNFYHSFGIPKEKLIIGSPWYSRGWGGVPAGANGDGLYQTATGKYTGTWDDPSSPGGQSPWFQLKKLENSGSWKKYFDEKAYVPYLYDGSNFLTYEDEQSLTERCNFVKKYGFGGIIVWEISGDDLSNNAPLSTIVYNELFVDTAVKQTHEPGSTDPTGISSVESAPNTNVFYTLTGVKVSRPQKGVYVRDGRKVIVK